MQSMIHAQPGSLLDDPEFARKAHAALDVVISSFENQNQTMKIVRYSLYGLAGLMGLSLVGLGGFGWYAYNEEIKKEKNKSSLADLHTHSMNLSNFKGTQPTLFLDVIQQIRNYNEHRRKGGSPLMHMLFYGPPGTGKTERAKAIAAELGAYLRYAKPGEIMGSEYIGHPQKMITKIFEEARNHKPEHFKSGDKPYAVILFDEIDAVAKDRKITSKHGHEVTMNHNPIEALLAESDPNNRENEGILVIGTTNKSEDIDAAMKSRLKIKIGFGLPSAQDLKEICLAHTTQAITTHKLYNAKLYRMPKGVKFPTQDTYTQQKDDNNNLMREESSPNSPETVQNGNVLSFTQTNFSDIDFKEKVLKVFSLSPRDVKSLLDLAQNRAVSKTIGKSSQGDTVLDLMCPGTIQNKKPRVTQTIYDEVLKDYLLENAGIDSQSITDLLRPRSYAPQDQEEKE